MSIKRTKIILDVDPGHDDALAMLIAAAAPELEVKAVTVVAGNQTLDKTLANALKVFTIAGITNIPVAAGVGKPLIRDQITAPHVHGETGLDGPDLPEPSIAPHPLHAVDLIIKTLLEDPGKITLVPVGPLTNIAVAMLKEPAIKDKIERIVLMGGSSVEGNITPAAEFNIFVDPEAARVVFRSGVPITMVGLDVTHKAIVTSEDSRRVRAMGGQVARVVSEFMDFYAQFHKKVYGIDGSHMHDPVAVAEVIRPGLVKTKKMFVDVDCSGGICYGRTVCDVWGVTGRAPNVDVGLDLDLDAFREIMFRGLQAYAAAEPAETA